MKKNRRQKNVSADVRSVSLDEMMTDDKYKEVATRLHKALENRKGKFLVRDGVHLTQLQIRTIDQALNQSIVPNLGRDVPGSAMSPEASSYWHIGIFGSVWLDIDLAGELCRVGFNPNDEQFYVELE